LEPFTFYIQTVRYIRDRKREREREKERQRVVLFKKSQITVALKLDENKMKFLIEIQS